MQLTIDTPMWRRGPLDPKVMSLTNLKTFQVINQVWILITLLDQHTIYIIEINLIGKRVSDYAMLVG